MGVLIRKCFILICLVWLPFPLQAAEAGAGAQLSKTVNAALDSLAGETGLVLAPHLRSEIVSDYVATVGAIDPKKYPDPAAARKLKNYYSSREGVKEIVTEWLKETDNQLSDEIYSVGATAEMKIFFGSQSRNGVLPYIAPNMRNKYATLIVESEARNQDAAVFLDNVEVCLIEECKAGLKVASNRPYRLVIKKQKYEDYNSAVSLKPQERLKIHYVPGAAK